MKHARYIKKKYATCFLLLLPLSLFSAEVQADFVDNLNNVRDLVAQLPISEEDRSRLNDLISFSEQKALDSGTPYPIVAELMHTVLLQIAEFVLPDQSTNEGSQPLQEPDPEDLIDQILVELGEAQASLFFDAGGFVSVFESATPPPEGCSVSILVRALGSVLSDPGGTYTVNFAHSVDVEARVQPSGGQFEWQLEWPAEEILPLFFAQGDRFSFRAVDPGTYRLTVRYSLTTSGPACEDVIWIRTQGGFPDSD